MLIGNGIDRKENQPGFTDDMIFRNDINDMSASWLTEFVLLNTRSPFSFL
jgi:hypothetical protein